MSTWESPVALDPGSPLPPPFSRMVIGELLCRTSTGGYLYRVGTQGKPVLNNEIEFGNVTETEKTGTDTVG